MNDEFLKDLAAAYIVVTLCCIGAMALFIEVLK